VSFLAKEGLALDYAVYINNGSVIYICSTVPGVWQRKLPAATAPTTTSPPVTAATEPQAAADAAVAETLPAPATAAPTTAAPAEDQTVYTKVVFANLNDGSYRVGDINLPRDIGDSFIAEHGSYRVYPDQFIFLSGEHTACLVNLTTMAQVFSITYPTTLDVTYADLSHDRKQLALTTADGLYTCPADTYSVYFALKELVATTTDKNGVSTGPAEPCWAADDEYIYYSVYSNNVIQGYARTTTASGTNERLRQLDGKNSQYNDSGVIFYYTSSLEGTQYAAGFAAGLYSVATGNQFGSVITNLPYYGAALLCDGSCFYALSENSVQEQFTVFQTFTKKILYSQDFDKINYVQSLPDTFTYLICYQDGGATRYIVAEMAEG